MRIRVSATRRSKAPHCFDELIGEAARQSLEPPVLYGLLQLLQREEPPARLRGDERLEPPGRPLALGLGPEFPDEAYPRRKRRAARDLACSLSAPVDDAAGLERESAVALAREFAEPPRDLRRNHPLDRGSKRAILQRRGAALGLEMHAGESADQMALDRHCAIRIDAAEDRAWAFLQSKLRRRAARAPVDEPLHQRLVQRVGEPILQGPGPALPRLRIGEPVGAIGDIGQRAHPREARRQRVDVAFEPVEARELGLHPIFRQPPVALREDARTSPRPGARVRLAWSSGNPASGRLPTTASDWIDRDCAG